MPEKCDEIKELLPLYGDGGLSAEEVILVEKHAAFCEACRVELESLNNTVEVLKNLPKYQASSGLLTEVRKVLKKSRTILDLVRPGLKWGGPLAAAALALIFFKVNGILPVGRVPVLEKQPAPAGNKPGIPRTAKKAPHFKKGIEANGMSTPLLMENTVSQEDAADRQASGKSLAQAFDKQSFQSAYEGETSETASGLKRKNVVIRSERGWKSFYASTFPGKDIPSVDFSGKMVVGVIGDEGIGITSTNVAEGKFLVSYSGVKGSSEKALTYCCIKVIENTKLEIVFRASNE